MKEAREDQVQQVQILMTLTDLARRHVHLIEPHVADLMNPRLWQPMSAYSVTTILQFYALESEVCVCACARARVCVCVCARARARVCVCVCEGGGGGGERGETDRQTDGLTDGRTNEQTDRQADRLTDGHRERQRDKLRQGDIQTGTEGVGTGSPRRNSQHTH